MREFAYGDLITLLSSLRWTLVLTVVAFLSGAVGGLVIGLARHLGALPLRLVAFLWVRLFQGVPLLIVLLVTFFLPPILLGVDVNPWVAVSFGFACYSSANLGEILRGALEAVPQGQREAARVLGMRPLRVLTDITLPQALRLSIIPSLGFFIQLLKGTSLASVVGFIELTRTAQVINNATFNPFLIFGLVGALYFFMCWPLSLLCRRLEHRFPLAT